MSLCFHLDAIELCHLLFFMMFPRKRSIIANDYCLYIGSVGKHCVYVEIVENIVFMSEMWLGPLESFYGIYGDVWLGIGYVYSLFVGNMIHK